MTDGSVMCSGLWVVKIVIKQSSKLEYRDGEALILIFLSKWNLVLKLSKPYISKRNLCDDENKLNSNCRMAMGKAVENKKMSFCFWATEKLQPDLTIFFILPDDALIHY